MKSIIKKISIFSFLIATCFIACNDDYLERAPLDAMTDASFWKTSDDLKSFVNGFYTLLPRYLGDNVGGSGGSGSNDGGLDNPSDILVTAGPHSALMRAQSSGQAPDADGNWSRNYSDLRDINYFLGNYSKVSSRDESANQYIGEGYFFRAYVYFQLLVRFGNVPYITKPLNVSDTEELYKPRDSRYDVAKWIINDLDSAIILMNWKGKGSASEVGRVNKEAAIVMKARVALFEGTWERYHSGSDFGVAGKDGKDFLAMIEPTVQQLIDNQGTNIFRAGGPLNEAYNQMESQMNASNTAGAFLYRAYDASLIGGHSMYEKMYRSPNYTDNMVNSYLDKDGNPQSLSSYTIDEKSLYSQSKFLDPRFKQTIWTPEKGPMKYVAPGLGDNAPYLIKSRYPYISFSQYNYFSTTGYRPWKGAILDYREYRNGSTDDIIIRYAEGLLAYAEAKAILGTITQADIDKTVNLLRSRVGMAPMNLAAVNSWSNSVYSERLGFDLAESNIVNEIRRERLVELTREGFRLNDLKRWAVYENVINGYKPKGAHIDQFFGYYNNIDSLLNDGYSSAEGAAIELTLNNGFNVTEDGYINPFYLNPDFKTGGVGYYIDSNRDYLSPIPKGEIKLYKENGGVDLDQNPGWF